MRLPARKLLAYAEFLALERELGRKCELVDGVVTAMTGGTIAHALLVSNVIRALGNALEGTPCRVHSSEQRLRIGRDRAYYPDAAVTCGPIPVDPDDPHAICDAQLVVEVLSPTTARYDRTAKTVDYQSLPSCLAVVLVNPDRVCIERWRKEGGGDWGLTLHGPDDRMPLLHERALSVKSVYDGVPLDSASLLA